MLKSKNYTKKELDLTNISNVLLLEFPKPYSGRGFQICDSLYIELLFFIKISDKIAKDFLF